MSGELFVRQKNGIPSSGLKIWDKKMQFSKMRFSGWA